MQEGRISRKELRKEGRKEQRKEGKDGRRRKDATYGFFITSGLMSVLRDREDTDIFVAAGAGGRGDKKEGLNK
jgi:hypothetical protein